MAGTFGVDAAAGRAKLAQTPRLMRIPLLLLPLLLASLLAAAPAGDAPRWYKGNTHTHSLWSDGDDYPEMIADWYKRAGYHFLALSDHNILSEGARWFELKAPVSLKGEVVQRGGGEVLQKYLRRFGPDWVELRENAGRREVRLKPLAEFAPLLNEPGKFLLIPAEEITGAWTRPKTDTSPALTGPVHINVTNPRDLVPAVNAADAVTVMQRTLEAVDAQRERTGQPMFAHLNHPNFRWGVTAEEMMRVERLRFFEVYNGHPGVENAGDATRLSMDAMWDAILAFRLSELNFGVVYGVATDDSHHYHKVGPGRSSSGRGWVMVRARHLTAESMIRALEAGDFYGTSGVTLREVVREPGRLAVEVEPEAGVSYRIQFIGTRRGFDRRSEEMPAPADEKPARRTLNHRRYSPEVGTVLAESTGPRAEYRLKGDELYVRAKVISSKPKADGSVPGEWETAWVQPVVGPRP